MSRSKRSTEIIFLKTYIKPLVVKNKISDMKHTLDEINSK